MNRIFQIILLLCFNIIALEALGNQINRIVISGNNTVKTSTIEEYSGLKIGDEYSDALKNDSVRQLYSTDLFKRIKINYKDGNLKIFVVENKFISDVKFIGNSTIKTDMLEMHTSTITGASLKEHQVQSDVKKIKEIYQRSGKFAIIVTSEIKQLDNNRVEVIFNIKEGPKAKIKNIFFVGNKNYTDTELKSVIMTKESKWFNFFNAHDSYDPDKTEHDKYLLKRFYGSVGFIDFRVISANAELSETKDGFVITYSVDEGKKYNFGEMEIINEIPQIKDDSFAAFSKIKKGELFSVRKLEVKKELLKKFLEDNNSINVNIIPDAKINPDTESVDVIFRIRKATKYYLNKININGNLKTEDQVIRRELKIDEGDVFNKLKIDRAERRIKNLNYFSNDLKLIPEKSDQIDRYDLNITVEEKSTSNIAADVGYDTSGGPIAKLSFIERNLIGTGRNLKAGINVAKKSIYYNLGLSDPYFMGSNFALGSDLYHSNNSEGSKFGEGEQKNYSSRSTGFNVFLGHNITNDLSHKISYNIKHRFLDSSNTSSVLITEQLGTNVLSSISNYLMYDKTDNRYFSKNGYLLSASQEFAGIGGTTHFLKHEVKAKFYKSFDKNKYTLSFIASGGHMQGLGSHLIRISDRFNLGGNNLRGFAQNGVGPRVKGTIDKESLGGQKYYTLTTELSFPLSFIPKDFDVSGSVFLEAGSLWDVDSQVASGFDNTGSIRASVGFGFLWITQMAPIRVDWGFPLKKEPHDKTQRFNLRFSTQL